MIFFGEISLRCHFSYTCYRSLLVRTPIAYSPCMSYLSSPRAIGQSGQHVHHVPIRAPERSSHLGGQMILVTYSWASCWNTHASFCWLSSIGSEADLLQYALVFIPYTIVNQNHSQIGFCHAVAYRKIKRVILEGGKIPTSYNFR